MKTALLAGLSFCLLFVFCAPFAAKAAEPPKQPVTIKLEGGKMAPVIFSHAIHVEKQKIDCVKCHHKDPQNPVACTTCHEKEAKGKTPSAREAFHTRCQTCHKEMAAKGLHPPTKCMECHKR
jgi:hypothetical protein